MRKGDQIKSIEPIAMRRGFPIYAENPSLAGGLRTAVKPGKAQSVGRARMVFSDTGEVLGEGAVAFINEKEVDDEQFVKVYLAHVSKIADLSKAGSVLLAHVFRVVGGSKDMDTIDLSPLDASDWERPMTRATFFRGLKDLLEQEFLYKTKFADKYFINVRYMFNGNRMLVATDYRRRGTSTKAVEAKGQGDLFEGGEH